MKDRTLKEKEDEMSLKTAHPESDSYLFAVLKKLLYNIVGNNSRYSRSHEDEASTRTEMALNERRN